MRKKTHFLLKAVNLWLTILGLLTVFALLWVVSVMADDPAPIGPVPKIEPAPERQVVPEKKGTSAVPTVEPNPERGYVPQKPTLAPVPATEGGQERSLAPQKGVSGSVPTVQGSAEGFIGPQEAAISPVETVRPMDGMSYQVVEFKDFRGGLNLSSYKTKVAPNQALVLENALWNENGEMYKRPGYDTLKTTPEVFNFLYRYYQQDGDKYLMGGSDTALYFWEEDSSAWTYLIGTEGTSGRWDGTTYEDVFVGTHEGVQPVFWDGDSILSVTTLESPDSFYVEWSTIVMDTVYTDCYRFRSVFTLTSPPASFETNELIGYTFEWYQHAGSSEIQRMLVLSNTADEIHTTLTCSLDLVPDKPERWCWLRPWFHSTSVDSGTTDSVTVCYDDPTFCCFKPGDYAPSVRFWDSDLDTTKLGRDWTYIFAATDSRGNVWRNYIENYLGFGVTGGEPWVMMNGWMVACFDEATEYEIYRLSSLLEDEGAKYAETFDDRLWIGWEGTGTDQEKNVLNYSELRQFVFLPDNEIYLTPGDGDYITGMISLSDARHVDVPTHLLMVSKNASSYKIIPTSTAGLYDSWYISTRVGCVSNSAMSVAEGLVLFPDQDGVWAWDQRGRPQCISLLIDPIFEDLALANLEDMSAIYNPRDRHYCISLPVDIDTVINGEFITTFKRDSAGTKDQYVHLMTTLGGEQGGDIQITDDTSSSYCDIASDTLGNYCVLVKDVLNLFLFRFDSLNARVGETIKINDIDSKVTPAECHVDMNNNGQIVVVWEDFRDGSYPTGTWDVYGQCLGFSYGKNGTNFHVNSAWETIEERAEQVSVAINDDSVCIFTWRDLNDTDFQTCIFATMDTFPIVTVANDYFKPWGGWHNPNGECQLVQSGVQGACVNVWTHPDVDAGDTTFVIVCIDDPLEAYGRYIVMNYELDTLSMGFTGQIQMNGSQQPSVSMNKKGRFVITWMHVKGASDYKIYAIKQDVGGAASGPYFRVDYAADGISTTYPAVALNEEDQYCIVWWDERSGQSDYYRCYTWDGGAVSGEALLNDIPNIDGAYYHPEITATNTWLEIDTTKETLAWNIDYHGWSKESFSASAYAYQHGLTDPVKVIFADPEDTKVYNYGTRADDVDDAVILTYQSPYFGFSQWPSYDYQVRYATIEAELDTGTVYVDWYKNYSDLTYQDSIMCGTDCREELALPDTVRGKNISVKITTGSEIDNFTLSRIWLEYLEDPNRK